MSTCFSRIGWNFLFLLQKETLRNRREIRRIREKIPCQHCTKIKRIYIHAKILLFWYQNTLQTNLCIKCLTLIFIATYAIRVHIKCIKFLHNTHDLLIFIMLKTSRPEMHSSRRARRLILFSLNSRCWECVSIIHWHYHNISHLSTLLMEGGVFVLMLVLNNILVTEI